MIPKPILSRSFGHGAHPRLAGWFTDISIPSLLSFHLSPGPRSAPACPKCAPPMPLGGRALRPQGRGRTSLPMGGRGRQAESAAWQRRQALKGMIGMMFWHGGGWAWWQAGLMWLAMIAFWALLIWAIHALVTGIIRGPDQPELDGQRRSGEARRI